MRLLLHKKHFIQLEAIYETKETVYIVMEYLEGETLLDLEEEYAQFLPQKRQIILKQLLEAQVVLEEMGIIHRDLKPDNIMVIDNNHKIKILDFGLAIFSDQNNEIRRAGTPGFMAPEMLEDYNNKCFFEYSSKIDIYSIGIVHYCMTYGRHPFDGEDANEVLVNNKNGIVELKNTPSTS